MPVLVLQNVLWQELTGLRAARVDPLGQAYKVSKNFVGPILRNAASAAATRLLHVLGGAVLLRSMPLFELSMPLAMPAPGGRARALGRGGCSGLPPHGPWQRSGGPYAWGSRADPLGWPSRSRKRLQKNQNFSKMYCGSTAGSSARAWRTESVSFTEFRCFLSGQFRARRS